MPDYFDRLLARHAPSGLAGLGGPPPGVGGAGGPVRVRPRLPGPYERIESLRAGAPPWEPLSVAPATPPPAVRQEVPLLREREVRSRHHTVVRTEVAREEEPRPATPLTAPVLRPVAPPPRALRPVPSDPPGRRRRAPAADAPEAPRPAAAVSAAPRSAEAAPVAAAPLRPATREDNAVREAARATAARRRPRSQERVVQVQIGRLEVSAAGSPGPSRGSTERPAPAGRPAPTLSLQDYLSRGERKG